VARRIKGEMKRRKTDPASNQFPKCPPPSGTQRFRELGKEEKGEGGDRINAHQNKQKRKR